jgi:PKHD-type hydroxylase
MFLHIPHVVNEDRLIDLRAALLAPDAAWIDGRATAGHQGVKVKLNQQLDESSPLARELGGLIIGLFERNPLFVTAILPNRNTNLSHFDYYYRIGHIAATF